MIRVFVIKLLLFPMKRPLAAPVPLPNRFVCPLVKLNSFISYYPFPAINPANVPKSFETSPVIFTADNYILDA